MRLKILLSPLIFNLFIVKMYYFLSPYIRKMWDMNEKNIINIPNEGEEKVECTY
jgi:hypothetical protein